MNRAIDYRDLLEIKWAEGGEDSATGLDCVGALKIAYARGGHVLAPADMPREWTAETELPSPWRFLGASSVIASELLDVILSHGERGYHVSCLVDERNRLVLTSTKEHGVHSLPVRRVQGIVGVYRLTHAARLASTIPVLLGGGQ